MWVYLSLILFLLQVDSRLPFNKELLLQPVEMDAYCTWWHTRVTWLNESHIWCTLYSSITSGSIAGCSSPHTRRKQSGIRSFDLNWLHLLLPKYTGNNVVFKSNIWNWDSIYLLVLTWKKKKMTVIEILPLQMKPLELFSSCSSLRIFIWAVKTTNALSTEMSPLQGW